MAENETRLDFYTQGYLIKKDIFSTSELRNILSTIEQSGASDNFSGKANDLFAIRRLFKAIPDLPKLLFNKKISAILKEMFGERYFVSKAIYFDKPVNSNWFVSYHQDLTITVDEKHELEGFSSWTVKDNSFGVQPPVTILEKNFTVRIHLDDTTIENGALKVLKGSHRNGILRTESFDRSIQNEQICDVPKGGIMIMSPLLMHSSGRTKSTNRRRVIHIEFSQELLPEPLKWAEYFQYN